MAPPSQHNDSRLIGYSLIIALGASSFGFDQSETGGFLAMPTFNRDFGQYDPMTKQYFLSAAHQTLMYGVEVAFIFIGSMLAGYLSNFYGRKIGLYLCATTCIFGACIQMAPYYPALVVGRSILGLSIGFAAVYTIAFWSEIATPRMRGVVVIFYQFSLTVANFIAIQNLSKIRGATYTQEEITSELEETIRFTRLEKELHESTSYLDCFRGTDLRRTLLTILAMAGQQCQGVAFMAAYLTYFFSLTGLTNAFVVTVIASGVSIAGALAAFPVTRYCGRRPVLIVGSFSTGVCMLAFASVAEADPGSPAAAKSIVAFITIFQFAYSASWGSVSPIIIGELPSNRLRSKTTSIALGVSWMIALLVICGIPYLIGAQYANIGTKVGFIFGGLTAFVFIATVAYLPETKDRSLEEIDEMFINRVPTRGFKNYVCTGQVADYDVSHFSTKVELIEERVEKGASV